MKYNKDIENVSRKKYSGSIKYKFVLRKWKTSYPVREAQAQVNGKQKFFYIHELIDIYKRDSSLESS